MYGGHTRKNATGKACTFESFVLLKFISYKHVSYIIVKTHPAATQKPHLGSLMPNTDEVIGGGSKN